MTDDATIHIVGAGLAGLSAATKLAEGHHAVSVYEASPNAGGRCRSYFDASFGGIIDNGNHLLLSGNRAAMAYLARIGAEDKLTGPDKPEFDFMDLATGERWTVALSEGVLPFWLFDEKRRVPGTKPADYLSAAQLMWAKPYQTVTKVLGRNGELYRRLWHPLMVSALNTDPEEASAQLAGAVMRNTLAKGGAACIPLIAEGLAEAFVTPALIYLDQHAARVTFGQRLKAFEFAGDKVAALEFGNGTIVKLGEKDKVILAVPPQVASQLLPGIDAPDDFRAILNAHFRISPPRDFPQIMGVINGTIEWIFAFPDRISITVSAADRLMDIDREKLATDIWREVAVATGLSGELPTWQIVKEKRATFAARPDQDDKRPDTQTKWSNLLLAGDWVQTGLPATIEGAIKSGVWAADLAIKDGRGA